MKILIIEDEEKTIEYIKGSLLNNSYVVDIARDGETGSFMARTNTYDIVIVDFNLPVKNGLLVCKEIKSSDSKAAVMFLSSNQNIKNKVLCLDAGADDYITKPFSLEELNARIKVVMRRPKLVESSLITSGDIVIDTKKQTVHKAEKSIYLTRTEYDVLEFIVRNKGMILSRGMIMEHVWSANVDPFSNTVEAHIANIRRKISTRIEDKNEIIKNVAGRGYIISP